MHLRVIEGGRGCSTGRKPIVWSRCFGADGADLVILDHETNPGRTTLAVDEGDVLVGIRDVPRAGAQHDQIVGAWRAWATAEGRQIRDERCQAELVRLADGEATQALIPGVEPVSAAARDLAALQARKAARRGHAALPSGGLFDETARAQQELF
ncbi:MAG TPA: hypothetical protein VIJ94_04235 [Caulobacteraceae bacterium]